MAESKNAYEGMFVLDAGAGDFEAASQPVRTALERSEAEVLAMKPWDERKLAYPIEGRRRGLYVLSYFKVDPERTADIERDCQLNEQILRVLILRRETLTDAEIQADTPATASKKSSRPERRETSGGSKSGGAQGTPAQGDRGADKAPEAPKAGGEAPKDAAPKADAPKADAPKTEAPKADTAQPAEAPAPAGGETAATKQSTDQAGPTG